MVRTSRGGLDMRLTVSILLMFIFINMWTIGPFEKDSPPICPNCSSYLQCVLGEMFDN